jgi:predicted Rossmann-fold nucleotide-binding protein
MFEVLTLTQTSKVRKRPIVLVGREFWSKLIDWQWLVDTGMIAAEDLNLFHLVETGEEAWAVLEHSLGLDAPSTVTGEFADDV